VIGAALDLAPSCTRARTAGQIKRNCSRGGPDPPPVFATTTLAPGLSNFQHLRLNAGGSLQKRHVSSVPDFGHHI